MERLPRKLKKKVRVCCICLTGNPYAKKEKIDKARWIILKNDFTLWLSVFSMENRKDANSVHMKEFSYAMRKRIKNNI